MLSAASPLFEQYEVEVDLDGSALEDGQEGDSDVEQTDRPVPAA